MTLPVNIRKIVTALAALVVVLLTAASPAAASSSSNYHAAIRDCFDDGQLQGHYSRHVLQQAIQHLPSDAAEYSDCADVLRRALNAGSGGGGGGGSAGSAIPGNPNLTTPSGAQAGSQQALKDLQQQTRPSAAAPKVDLAGSPITPAAAHVDARDLPTSLLASLIALGVLSAIAGLLVIRRRWPEMRRVALSLLRR